jgi:UDP-N-acetylmuramoylalanine--D-glutamate ligase
VLNRQDNRVMAMALRHRSAISFGLDVLARGNDFGLREMSGASWIVRGQSLLLALSELPMAGLHNAANVMAALALCEAVGLQVEALLPALRNFQGLPHRVERIAEIDGVAWYDDSKGTNVGATVAALEGLQRKVVLIAGGDGKGQDFTPLGPACELHARAVVLIGRDAPKIRAAIEGIAVPLLSAATLEEAVRVAADHAQPGDAVLLSPACASFDMFRNYEHRAQVFIAAVRALGEAVA